MSKSVITVADYSGMDIDDENLTDSAISTDTGSDVKSDEKVPKGVADYELSADAKKLAVERKEDGREGTKITSLHQLIIHSQPHLWKLFHQISHLIQYP